jgi:hypothetical protein
MLPALWRPNTRNGECQSTATAVEPRLVILTPHPINVYPVETPDRIQRDSVIPVRVLPPSGQHGPARLGQRDQGVEELNLGVPVHRVAFGLADGGVDDLPEPGRERS